jgi:hypothetical protein
LTTKDQGVIFERTMEPDRNQPPPKERQPRHGTDPGSYSWKLLLIKDARVHYVVLKQQPRTTHPTHAPAPKDQNNRVIGAARKPETNNPTPQPPGPKAGSCAMVLLPQDPTVCQTLPSGSHRRTFQDPDPEGNPIRTCCRPVPPGTYLLIFHP